ncbi:hypothetical protein SLS58_001219 [Diplodia intermedia]|uniref:Uncharacterized protein n=1 Tax=Diplodia intermedia TaxID=856260 RepID=A0ABR3U397_9PEZI
MSVSGSEPPYPGMQYACRGCRYHSFIHYDIPIRVVSSLGPNNPVEASGDMEATTTSNPVNKCEDPLPAAPQPKP